MHTCPRSTHTHTHLKDYKAVWQNPQTLNTPPLLENPEVFLFIFVQNSSIGQQLSQHSQHYTPWWNCITATAVNNFQLTFIQPMYLLVTDFWYTHWVCCPVCQHPTLKRTPDTMQSRMWWTKHDTTYTSGPLHSTIIQNTIKQHGVCLHWRLLSSLWCTEFSTRIPRETVKCFAYKEEP